MLLKLVPDAKPDIKARPPNMLRHVNNNNIYSCIYIQTDTSFFFKFISKAQVRQYNSMSIQHGFTMLKK